MAEADAAGREPQPVRGRPTATTRETIEEAACELFLERGYEATSVTDIARRAGVSRSSFFNYFTGKTDVLWGPVFRALDGADAAFEAAAAEHREPGDVVRAAILALARQVDASSIPVAASQAELMGTGRALLETGAVLVLERAGVLRERLARLDPGGDRLAHAAYASAVTGGVAAACIEWMRAGTDRGELAPYIERALAGLPQLPAVPR
ncbi:TetR family transcriptional regulator [Pseudoclavibacter endophyticus]|uniref:TetR/AcrR family transcriptional regulator n=1 Tax=Pseudoclavibacter endophyticus TaxID=1778590 RepID=UPI0019A00069|nr:TetR/AcrR family transcriptional regulator [Pseudoclavibacter endophyticus]GGA75533.1 TetR family transcriptional regulator [Pseudoclavibacter endophyticus]